MSVVFLVPRRADGGHRDRLWNFCRKWWEDRFDWPIIEGSCSEGPFNRAEAINNAAQGSWDVAVVIDSDVVCNEDQVRAAVDHALDTGRLTLAYERYVNLNQSMTQQVLSGYDGSWEPGVKYKMTTHTSSVVVVPRGLWDAVQGYDERFLGWAPEDSAFAQACRVLGGGVDRIPGTVWHLFHEDSPERNLKSGLYKAANALARRYKSTFELDKMRALIAERTEPDGIALVVLTHGRRECISQTIPSAEANLKGPVVRRYISDDSGDIDYQAWLRVEFPAFEIVTGKPAGFAGNVIRGRNVAIDSGQRFVFWLEDDFIFEQPVDLPAMVQVLTSHPYLAQMALKRQAWFPSELKVGGFIEEHPEDYTEHTDGEHRWLEHQRFFTTNPHLTTRVFLAEHDWPKRAHSESAFSRQVLTGERKSGYWGARSDPPRVRHFGERTGRGY